MPVLKSGAQLKKCLRLGSERGVLFTSRCSPSRYSILDLTRSATSATSASSSSSSESMMPSTTSKFQRSKFYRRDIHELNSAICSQTGRIGDMPLWYRFGYVKLTVCIVASLFLGSVISKSVTTFLEENDIFKPEDDDDDEDD